MRKNEDKYKIWGRNRGTAGARRMREMNKERSRKRREEKMDARRESKCEVGKGKEDVVGRC